MITAAPKVSIRRMEHLSLECSLGRPFSGLWLWPHPLFFCHPNHPLFSHIWPLQLPSWKMPWHFYSNVNPLQKVVVVRLVVDAFWISEAETVKPCTKQFKLCRAIGLLCTKRLQESNLIQHFSSSPVFDVCFGLQIRSLDPALNALISGHKSPITESLMQIPFSFLVFNRSCFRSARHLHQHVVLEHSYYPTVFNSQLRTSWIRWILINNRIGVHHQLAYYRQKWYTTKKKCEYINAKE